MTNLGLSGFLILVLTAAVRCQTLQNVKDLHTKLFVTEQYNKYIRSIANQTNPIEIIADLHLRSIIGFNEQEESLTTSGYLSLIWTDDSLKWNPRDYGDIAQIIIPQDHIWTPDITLRNSFDALAGLGYTDLNARIDNDGVVYWDPYQILKSTCDVDIIYFPFDTQTCRLTFITWSYETNRLHLLVDTNGKVKQTNNYSPNSQWTLVDSSVEEDFDDASVTFTLKLERKPSFYVMNIIVPVVMLSVLSIFIFALPVKSGERASFAVTVFLSLAVFLTIVASELPTNSDVISLLGVYLLAMSVQSTVTALMSVLEIRLAMRDEREGVPEIGATYRFICKIASTFRYCRRCSEKHGRQKLEDSSVTVHPLTDNVGGNITDDVKLSWNVVVEAIDFLFFWITSLITLIGTVLLFLWSMSKSQIIENFYYEDDYY